MQVLTYWDFFSNFEESIMEMLRTLRLVGISYVLGLLVVWLTWPVLSPLTAQWPVWLPALVSGVLSFLMLVVITHMERGQLDPQGYTFKILYLGVCLGFGLSTLPPSQYNTGMASMEMAFVMMLTWKIFRQVCKPKAQSVR